VQQMSPPWCSMEDFVSLSRAVEYMSGCCVRFVAIEVAGNRENARETRREGEREHAHGAGT